MDVMSRNIATENRVITKRSNENYILMQEHHQNCNAIFLFSTTTYWEFDLTCHAFPSHGIGASMIGLWDRGGCSWNETV